jgi:hypothetical protein
VVDFSRFVSLIILSVNKSSGCNNNVLYVVDRYVNVYWSFIAMNVVVAILLLIAAIFIRVVIRDYEAEEEQEKPTVRREPGQPVEMRNIQTNSDLVVETDLNLEELRFPTRKGKEKHSSSQMGDTMADTDITFTTISPA